MAAQSREDKNKDVVALFKSLFDSYAIDRSFINNSGEPRWVSKIRRNHDHEVDEEKYEYIAEQKKNELINYMKNMREGMRNSLISSYATKIRDYIAKEADYRAISEYAQMTGTHADGKTERQTLDRWLDYFIREGKFVTLEDDMDDDSAQEVANARMARQAAKARNKTSSENVIASLMGSNQMFSVLSLKTYAFIFLGLIALWFLMGIVSCSLTT